MSAYTNGMRRLHSVTIAFVWPLIVFISSCHMIILCDYGVSCTNAIIIISICDRINCNQIFVLSPQNDHSIVNRYNRKSRRNIEKLDFLVIDALTKRENSCSVEWSIVTSLTNNDSNFPLKE